MATFDEHIKQAQHNLQFLSSINSNTSVPDCLDWQVTVCFYAALHLVNAHLAQFSLQYRSHTNVKQALNPEQALSPSKLPEDEYVAYTALQMLSRRSRYLVNEKDGQIGAMSAAYTNEKHVAKAIRHLDRLATYFRQRYKLSLPVVPIHCTGIKQEELGYIKTKP